MLAREGTPQCTSRDAAPDVGSGTDHLKQGSEAHKRVMPAWNDLEISPVESAHGVGSPRGRFASLGGPPLMS